MLNLCFDNITCHLQQKKPVDEDLHADLLIMPTAIEPPNSAFRRVLASSSNYVRLMIRAMDHLASTIPHDLGSHPAMLCATTLRVAFGLGGTNRVSDAIAAGLLSALLKTSALTKAATTRKHTMVSSHRCC